MAGRTVRKRPAGWAARILLGASTMLATPAFAQEIVWTGGASTDWFTAGNWTGGVPGDSSDVRIDLGSANQAVIGTAGARTRDIVIGGTTGANGRLTINNNGALTTVGNARIGDGGGAGEVLVIGANASWSVAGSLQLGNAVGSNGRLTISQGATVTVGGGTGIVSVGSNGGAGSLFIGGDPCCGPGILRAGGVNLGTTGLLRFTHNSTNYNFAPVISGTGAVSVLSGITRLTGDSSGFTGTTTIGGGGTLHIGNADFSGFGVGGETGNLGGNIVNNGQLVLNRSEDFTFAAIISGSGSLTHNLPNAFSLNIGETTLPGVHSYTGATTINNGKLFVTGSIASSSSITVNGGSGTWLGGTGILPRVILASGTIAPGLGRGSIGTLTVAGDFSVTNGRYLAETAAGTSDRVNISGTASLGGRLAVVGTGGTYSSGSYTLLTATGGRSGTFATFDLIGAFGGRFASLDYTPNSVVLNLTQFTATDEQRWLAEPATNLFTTAGNWTTGAVPIGSARFGPSSQATVVFAPGTVQLGQMRFDTDAPAYTFNIDSAGARSRSLHFLGAGIVNDSAFRPSFFVLKADLNDGAGSTLNFLNNASAGNARISNLAFLPTFLAPDVLQFATNFWGYSTAASAEIANQGYGTAFHDDSTAANATFVNELNGFGGTVAFFDRSTAANATFDNSFEQGGVAFYGDSTAASAVILNRSYASIANGLNRPGTQTSGVYFVDRATAANARITNEAGGNTGFWGSSTAGNAVIVNSGASALGGFFSLAFGQTSTAGNATITNNQAGVTQFQDQASAGSATITNNQGGTLYFFGTSDGSGATVVNNAGGLVSIFSNASIGSLAGAGNVDLADKVLTLGNLNRDETIGGVIADGGIGGGTGGGLTKVGTGTLTLTGTNSYTGATRIDAGILRLGDGGATGAILGNIVNNAAFVIDRSGTLTLGGIISGGGTFTQNGSVTTTLSGASTFGGAMTINGGALLVTGSIASTSLITINNGALLGGTGTLGRTTIASGGTLSPGLSIGQIAVTGDLTFRAGSLFLVEISAAAADAVNVSGIATLGGSLRAIALGGAYAPGDFLLLTAAAGLSGTFSSFSTQGGFNGLLPSLRYTANSVFLTLVPMAAGDAMWSATPETVIFGGRADYQTGGNWVGGAVPTAIAIFGATSGPNIFFENQTDQQPITIQRFLFNADAPAYTFTLQSDELTFLGEGIVNNSAATQTIVSGNRSILRFANSSSAGNAALRVEGGTGRIFFENASSAGNSTITVGIAEQSAGIVAFSGNASAGNATINNIFGNVNFGGNSTAGNASITNQSGIVFGDSSSLGTARITNAAGGIRIFGSADGPGATIDNRAGATLDLSQLDGAPRNIQIGSLFGAGAVLLGNRTLTLGGLNRDETISGAIGDGGDLGGTGGALTKTGTGTLTLSGASTYTGATSVNGGTLLLTGSIAGAGQTAVGFSPGSNGRLVIQSGGRLTGAAPATVGGFGGIGAVLVTGAGSSWTSGGLNIGLAPTGGASGGIGSLTIEAGASVTSGAVNLQQNTARASDARVTVAGSGSVWNTGALGMTSAQVLQLLTISAGGVVTSSSADIAAAMLVTGQGSTWNSGALVLGPDLSANGTPRGNLTIAAGAIVNSTSAVVGAGGGQPSSALVEGGGSAWNTTGDLVIALRAVDGASLVLRNGGRVSVANGTGAVQLGSAGGLAFLTLGGGAPGTTAGTLDAASVQIGASSILSFEYAGFTNGFAPVIAGTGRVFVGGGTTILTGDSSAFAGTTTIDPGTLQIGDGGAGGALGGNIANNAALVINRTGSLTMAGTISGTGTLTQTGSVVTTLSGVNSYTGATRINGGTLLVTGTIAASAVTVNNGATLGGTGTAGTTNIASGGTLSPGLSVGTLSIAGNLTFASGSNFLVEVGPAASDRVNVSGTATLAGTLTALSLGGSFSASEYILLNAGGGLSGTFNTLVTQGTFSGLVPTLRYSGNSVFLVLAAGGEGPTNTATTLFTDALVFNAPTVTVQRVGLFETRVIGRLAGGASLFDQTFNAAFGSAAVTGGIAAARLAITNAGGPGVVVVSDPVLVSRAVTSSTSSASTFSLAGTSQVVTTVTTFGPSTVTIGDARSCGAAIAALPSGARPTCAAPGGNSFAVEPGTLNINTVTRTDYVINEARTDTVTETTRETYELTGTVVPVGTVHAAVQSGLFELGGRFLTRLGAEGAPGLFGERGDTAGSSSNLTTTGASRGWAEFYGYRARGDARGGIFAERRDAQGLAGGFTLSAGEGLLVGLAVDHGRLDLAVPGSGEEADVDMTQLAAAARLGAGPLSVNLAFAYGFGEVESRRVFSGTTATARYDVDMIGGAVEARYLLEAGAWRVVPVAALDWVRVASDAFTESGNLGLAAPHSRRERLRSAIGLEAGRSFPLEGGGRFDLTASGRYIALLSGEERALPIAFNAAPGTALTMRGLSERDSVALGAQAVLHLSGRLSLYAAYDGRFASGYDAHAGVAGLRITW